MTDRNIYNKRILGDILFNKVHSARLLLVGAGGIGCELLKNLVLSGFHNITVIDLDTIDVSNLNRQFLFQRQHVKKAKAHVARESALKFNPSVHINSLQANIKEVSYDIQWFKQFTLVLNALDNLDARRHVNAMCLAADIPLIESGTQGYLGQAYVIKKDVTECFDCQPKPTPTTYPVCTIRSTPSAPIHCIVWAKSFLFSKLFGDSEEGDLIEQADENAQELEALTKETAELKEIKDAMGSADYVEKVFDKVYNKDIKRLISMDSMWKNRTPPVSLDYKELSSHVQSDLHTDDDQAVWTVQENLKVFHDSIIKLSERLCKETSLSFDKDDEDAMAFVAAASNLRAHVFHIPTNSLFNIKSMAGNIIPAIATTNAIIAGVVIMKAFEVFRDDIKNIKRTYLTNGSRLVQESNAPPNPQCGVCRSRSSTVLVDFDGVTLAHLLEEVILTDQKGGAGMDREEVALMEGSRMLYDIEFDDNLQESLSSLGLKSGSIIRATEDEEHVDLILEPIVKMVDGGILKLVHPIPAISTHLDTPLKRKIADDLDYENSKKKKTSHTNEDDSIVILDDDDEVVLIDD